ncbi:MAG: nucleoside-diphosphate kinase [Nitrospirae bacterium]|nr:nucleoside-diphosphate kinase [Nitrospirota bacterium]MBI3352321.1 nucleoside-diphosphate kinase [Nitrospirota bacterium]
MEITLSLIKPDGVRKKVIGEVLRKFEQNGLQVIGLKMLHLTKKQAEGFYVVHKSRPFFNDLTSFMSSGPIVAMILKGENAIKKVREIMGATDPKAAEKGTIRREFGGGIEENVVHGSDSKESAQFEIPYFFDALGLNDQTL